MPNKVAMDRVNCVNCGSSQNQPYDQENGFSLVKCLQCGLLYVNPRPLGDAIAEAAQSGTYAGATILDVTGTYRATKRIKYKHVLASLFGDTIMKGSWLDVGCGHGEFLLALRDFSKNGLRLQGAEPNTAKAKSARAMGLSVGGLDFSHYTGNYDFISLLNVYSHLSNPLETIEQWGRLLTPGGQLIVETGDTAQLPRWRHPIPYSLPDHLSFASEKIVKDMLVRLQFKVIVMVKLALYDGLTSAYRVRQLVKLIVPGKRANLGWLPWNPKRDLWIRAQRLY